MFTFWFNQDFHVRELGCFVTETFSLKLLQKFPPNSIVDRVKFSLLIINASLISLHTLRENCRIYLIHQKEDSLEQEKPFAYLQYC
jgi:hypothetical protein